MAVLYQAKPNNVREENKDKPIALCIYLNMLNGRSCTWFLQNISFRAMHILGDRTEHSAYIGNYSLPKCSML